MPETRGEIKSNSHRNALRAGRAGCFHPGVFASKSFLRYWLPLLVWMGVIFMASADSESGPHASRFLGPFLRWLGFAPAAADAALLLARKAAHLTEFALLAVLAWRAIRRPVRADPRPWNWPQAGWALLLSAAYAGSDEFHQAFVPTRVASVWDVLIDTVGAAAGLLALWIWGRWRKRW